MDGYGKTALAEDYNRYGDELFANQQYAEAVRYYYAAAQLGNAKAQLSLGICYGKGWGIERNGDEALKWVTMAANQGEPDAIMLIKRHEQEASILLMQEEERKAREELLRISKEAELIVKAEAERKAKEEAERKAKEEAERKAKEEAERKAKEEAERKAKEEAERKAKEEAERKAKEEARRKENIKPVPNNADRPIRLCTLGNLGHGKTTLTAAINKYLALQGKAPYADYNSIHQGKAEKEHGLVHTASRITFATEQRSYELVDCPGHMDIIKNLIVRSESPDAAILVVSAAEGAMSTTRAQIALARQVGILDFIVFLNNCDQVNDEEQLLLMEMDIQEILDDFDLPGGDTPIIRGSALRALQSASTNASADDYDCIRQLLNELDSFISTPMRIIDQPFLMPVEDVFTITGRGTIATGKVDRGFVKPNDSVQVVGIIEEPYKTVVTGIEMFRKQLDYAAAGDTVGILLRSVDKTSIERGQVLALPGSIDAHSWFSAAIYLFNRNEGGKENPIIEGSRPQFYFRTTDITGMVSMPNGTMAMPGDYASVDIKLIVPIAMEIGHRFLIREGGRTYGVGVVTGIIE